MANFEIVVAETPAFHTPFLDVRLQGLSLGIDLKTATMAEAIKLKNCLEDAVEGITFTVHDRSQSA